MFNVLRRMIATVFNVIDLIIYHLLVVVVNTRKLITFLIRGTQTWIVMTGRLFMFVCIIGIGWYRLVKYWVFSPLILRNVEYGKGGKYRNLVDVYLPVPHNPMNDKYGQSIPSTPAPVVIFVSGGAWIIGYKMWSCLVARGLSYLGVVTIVPDYRNFPQGDIEDMMADIRAVIQWTTFNAPRFGGDPDKIVLAGQSAGAHICTCLLVDDYLKKKNSGQYFNAKEVTDDTVVNGLSAKQKRRRDSESGYDDVIAGLFNASEHIKLFIGVSGPYNLYALVNHMKNRGLDPSIMDYVCRGDVIRYSPTIQLAEYCHAQAINATNSAAATAVAADDDEVTAGRTNVSTTTASPTTPIIRGRATAADEVAGGSNSSSSKKKNKSTKSTSTTTSTAPLSVAVPSAAAAAAPTGDTPSTNGDDVNSRSEGDLQFVFFSTPPRGNNSNSTSFSTGGSRSNRPPLAPMPLSSPGAVVVKASSVVDQPSSSYRQVISSKHPLYAHIFPNVHKFLSTDDLTANNAGSEFADISSGFASHAGSPQYFDKYAASTNFLISSNGHDQQVVATPTAHLSDFPPVVLFHGAKDQSIPMSICSDLRDLLALHGACVDLKVYPHWTHTDAILEAPLSGNMRLFYDMAECIDAHTGSSVMDLNRALDSVESEDRDSDGSSNANNGSGGGGSDVKSRRKKNRRREPLKPMVSAYSVAIARRVNPF